MNKIKSQKPPLKQIQQKLQSQQLYDEQLQRQLQSQQLQEKQIQHQLQYQNELEIDNFLQQNDLSTGELFRLITIQNLDSDSIAQIMNLERICHVDQWTAENYTSELLRDFALCRGLWLDKILLGLTLFWILPPECHILNLMVHPKFWGRGLGRYLMQDLLDICKSRKTTKIALEVREGNIRAETLYLHLGFFCSGLRRGYYSDGSNAKNMTLKLTNPVETIKSVYISPSLNSPRRKS